MGFELLTQPQVFLAPITAVGGIQNGLFNDPLPPLYTSFYTWTSTASITATTFPLGGFETLTNRSGSYIVTVGGVVQAPSNYTVDPNTRLLTFDFNVNPDTPVVVTQIGTIASLLSVTGLTADNSVFQNSTFQHIGANSLLVTNLTAVSAEFQIIDIVQYELSGFSVLGDANITGNTNVTGTISAGNISVTGVLSAREIDLVHTPANDGVDPILDIGETTTEGFSGFRVRYEENTNRLLIQTVASSLTSNSVIIDRATGQVGISAVPNQALTVAGNISATGAIRAINNWPNRQYRILSADEAPFAANTGTVLWSATPFTIQPNCIYTVGFSTLISSTGSSPAYIFTLSGSAPFTILEGTAAGSVTNESSNPYFARDLRELNTSIPTNTYVAIPVRTYTSVGPHSFSISPIISAATTTQIVLSCFSNTLSRVKSTSNYAGSLIQTI